MSERMNDQAVEAAFRDLEDAQIVPDEVLDRGNWDVLATAKHITNYAGEDVAGKTIKAVHNRWQTLDGRPWDLESVMEFTDGTWTMFARNECSLYARSVTATHYDREWLVEIGVITTAVAEAWHEEYERYRKAYLDRLDRRKYEELRAKFDTP